MDILVRFLLLYVSANGILGPTVASCAFKDERALIRFG